MPTPNTELEPSAYADAMTRRDGAIRDVLGMGPARNADAATSKPEQPEADRKSLRN
jgi:hypothetical protein